MNEPVINHDLKVKVTNKAVLGMALPISLAILVPQLNYLINSIFLGNLGEDALGNAGITGVYYLIFAVAGTGLNNAMQTVFSRYAGMDDEERFKIILAQGIRISLVVAAAGILFTYLVAPPLLGSMADEKSYPVEMQFLKIRIWGLPFLYLFQMGNALLVASLNSRYMMIAFVVEAIVNIVFDYGLIFGKLGMPQLGFNGAAVASIMAEASAFFTIIIVFIVTGIKKKYKLLSTFIYNKQLAHQIVPVAIPLGLQYVISVSTWLVFFLLIEDKGTQAKAISNTIRNVFGLTGIFTWAFASTSSAMVSNLIGQGRNDLVIPAIHKISYWSIGFAGLAMALLNLFPHYFFGLFGQDAAFVQAGIPVIRMITVGMFFASIAMVWLNGVTGTGRTRVNLAIEIGAIVIYMAYTWYFMRVNYISLSMAWSNEIVYWVSVFLPAWWYIRSKRWQGGKMFDDFK